MIAAWTQAIRAAFGAPKADLTITGEGALPSCFHVTPLAAASIGAAALAAADLIALATGTRPHVTVDRRLASLWFGWSIDPIGWTRPPDRDPVTGDYPTQDGWIRLHTNAPHHRRAAESVLGPQQDSESTASAVAGWTAQALESAILAAGGCAAELRSQAAWASHPQGAAVAAEPLVHLAEAGRTSGTWTPNPTRPLAGIRVLDLTRILAGPVATRFLAGLGADVLRLDPPGWAEDSIAPEVTLGKRCARIDLRAKPGRARFEALLAGADILVHGYRSDALERLGLGATARRALNPGLIDVALCAYGWTGPWATRRGFDSLVQMSTGIVDTGRTWRGAEHPVPLPVQALDHATGYLLATAALHGLHRRLTTGTGTQARLSLARTAKLLADGGPAAPETPLAPTTDADFAPAIEATAWGPARRLRPPATIESAPLHWNTPANPLGSATPDWAA